MKIINYLNGLLYFFIPFTILLLIGTIFYYFDIFSTNIFKYFKIISLIISCLVSGLFIGKKSISKGYLNGIIFSLIIILIFLISSLFLDGIKWYQFIYYLIIMITTTIGSMIGINRKRGCRKIK